MKSQALLWCEKCDETWFFQPEVCGGCGEPITIIEIDGGKLQARVAELKAALVEVLQALTAEDPDCFDKGAAIDFGKARIRKALEAAGREE